MQQMSLYNDSIEHIRKTFGYQGKKSKLRYLLLGAVVGTASGFLALFFRFTIDEVGALFLGAQARVPFWQVISDVPTWKIFVVPTVIGAFVTYVTNKLAPEAQGHGVPEIMLAVATKRGVIRPRVSIVKLIGSALSIGSGFSVGREGPTALIGATIGSTIGQYLKLPASRMKMIVGCGAAAGIAATFNAPLAGTAFALELIVGEFSISYFAPTLIAAMIGTFVSHNQIGNVHVLFSELAFKMSNVGELILYFFLGMVVGLVGIIFTKVLYGMEDLADRLTIPTWAKGAIGGLGVSVMLLTIPHITGPATWDGIHYPLQAGNGISVIWFLLLLAGCKILATAWSLATGASGGIFAPTLMIGGCIGAAYGQVVNILFPHYSESPTGYALVGMGAMAAAVTQAPLTAITITLELTNDYAIILPLMLSCGAAVGVYAHYMNGSIYTIKLMRRGIFLDRGGEASVLQSLMVKEAMREENQFVVQDATVAEVLAQFGKAIRTSISVVDEKHRMVGVVSIWEIRILLENGELDIQQKVQSITRRDYKYVYPDQTLYYAFHLITEGDFTYIPVVSREDQPILIGRLSRHRVMQAYENAIGMQGIENQIS